jgi:hypothetical protein
MKTFVSYSFNDSELHIVSLLIAELRQKGLTVETSNHFGGLYLDDNKIVNCDFFVGIITNNSESINAVIREWRVAQSRNIKSVLVIEEGVRVNENPNLQFIRFNRNNPRNAIEQLLNVNRQNTQITTNTTVEDAVAFGAIVVGIAALITLLSSKK